MWSWCSDSWDGHLQVSWSFNVWSWEHLPHPWRDYRCQTGLYIINNTLSQFNFLLVLSHRLLNYWNVMKYLQERDPLERIRKLILSHDIATEKELKVLNIEFLYNFLRKRNLCLWFIGYEKLGSFVHLDNSFSNFDLRIWCLLWSSGVYSFIYFHTGYWKRNQKRGRWCYC